MRDHQNTEKENKIIVRICIRQREIWKEMREEGKIWEREGERERDRREIAEMGCDN